MGFAEKIPITRSFWLKHNADDVFSYDTIKIVRIRDRYLGIAHHTLQFFIFAYIIGYVIIWNKGFLATETPVAAVRMSIQQPTTINNLNQTVNDYKPLDQLSYCGPRIAPNITTYLPCVFWDNRLVTPLQLEESAMLITTRVSVSNLTLNATCQGYFASSDCGYISGPVNDYYVADIEDFTLLLSHSPRSPQLGIALNDNTKFFGVLQTKTGTGPKDWANVPNGDEYNIANFPNGDIISVEQLLSASKYSLDSPLTAGSNTTSRFTGIVMLLIIEYSNMETYHDLENSIIRYNYRPSVLRGIQYKYEEIVVNDFPQNLIDLNRHGIRLIILYTGLLAEFSIQVLLTQLTTSMALLKVSVTFVDILATSALPQKAYYKKAKFEKTEDFSAVREREELAEHGEMVRHGSNGTMGESLLGRSGTTKAFGEVRRNKK